MQRAGSVCEVTVLLQTQPPVFGTVCNAYHAELHRALQGDLRTNQTDNSAALYNMLLLLLTLLAPPAVRFCLWYHDQRVCNTMRTAAAAAAAPPPSPRCSHVAAGCVAQPGAGVGDG